MADQVIRSDLTAFLVGHLHILASRVGFPETDTLDGYAPALDATYTAMGYPGMEQDPGLPIEETEGARSLARYFGLISMLPHYALWIDTQVDAPTAQRKDSQVYTHLKDLLKVYAEDAANSGYAVDIQKSIEMGHILLDYNEPTLTTGAVGVTEMLSTLSTGSEW
jgi:hypothetical protein